MSIRSFALHYFVLSITSTDPGEKKKFQFVQYIVVMYLGSIPEKLHASAVVIFVHREWHEHRDNKIFTNVLRSQYKYIHARSLQRLTHIKTTLYSELSTWIAFK